MKKLITNNSKLITQKGFTLIELLLYFGILSILLTVLTQIFGSILDVQLESESNSAVQQDSRFILSRLSYDIHRADAIVLPSSLGQQTTSLQITINTVDYTYSLNGINLQLGTDNLNSSETSVSGLTFKRLGNNVANAKHTLQIQYTVTSKTVRNKGPETKNINTTIGIR